MEVRIHVPGWKESLATDLDLFVRVLDPDDPSEVERDDNAQGNNGDDNKCSAWSFDDSVTVVAPAQGNGRPELVSLVPGIDGLADFVFQFQADDESCGGDNYILEAQLATGQASLNPDGWAQSGTLVAWKRLYAEVGNSILGGLFLASDALWGLNTISCEWPERMFDGPNNTIYIQEASEQDVLGALNCDGQHPPGAVVWTCTNKPPVIVFDTSLVPDSQEVADDGAYLDTVTFSVGNGTVQLKLVRPDGSGGWLDYGISHFYDAGKGSGDKAAAVGRAVFYENVGFLSSAITWDEFDLEVLEMTSRYFADAFVDLHWIEVSDVYPHFWAGEKVFTDGAPLYRDHWFSTNSGVAGQSYGNIVNVVFDVDSGVYAGSGQILGMGITSADRNVTFIHTDSFTAYDPSTGGLSTSLTASAVSYLRTTVAHEVTHQFRINEDLVATDHCDQVLGYHPIVGSDQDSCLMAENSTPTSSPHLCQYCLLGGPINAFQPDLAIRRRDGLTVDTQSWNGEVQ